MRSAFGHQIYEAKIESSQKRLAAEEQEENRTDREANGRFGTQRTKASQLPLPGRKDSEYNSDNDKAKPDHDTSLERLALFQEPELGLERVETSLDRHEFGEDEK